MTKDQLKTLLDEVETQVALAKDSINNGDWDKAAVRVNKVIEKASEIEIKAKVLEGRKRMEVKQGEAK